jgi:hypothetical protein
MSIPCHRRPPSVLETTYLHVPYSRQARYRHGSACRHLASMSYYILPTLPGSRRQGVKLFPPFLETIYFVASNGNISDPDELPRSTSSASSAELRHDSKVRCAAVCEVCRCLCCARCFRDGTPCVLGITAGRTYGGRIQDPRPGVQSSGLRSSLEGPLAYSSSPGQSFWSQGENHSFD